MIEYKYISIQVELSRTKKLSMLIWQIRHTNMTLILQNVKLKCFFFHQIVAQFQTNIEGTNL